MATSSHQSTGSDEGTDQPSNGDQHKVVSGEGQAGPDESSPATDRVAESFDGTGSGGEIEAAAGFNASRAAGESLPFQAPDAQDDLKPAEVSAYADPETVCGSDDRVRISPANAAPWRFICQLIITMPNGAGYRGTGWFIGPRAVMTAGHCVFSRADGGWARRIEVIPGMDGAARPYGSAIGTSFRSVIGWTQNGDQNFDYGCIILPTPLGNTTGYFGFASLSNASFNNLLLNNSGYAGDKPFGTQWFNAGRVSSINSRKVYYMLDTYGGQSGSPVWRLANGQRHAVGIHAYGGCPNSATRINSEVFNNMYAWRSL
ncbi:trypsin-like serine peptidase [Vulcanococcus limneticus]|jgi:glutamyl endopeptidase|uniref:trypsin-like serine peptidase n=1 Tax=Vulcanococcus limneticus TaxID=2170428 RepID=UPI00398BD178